MPAVLIISGGRKEGEKDWKGRKGGQTESGKDSKGRTAGIVMMLVMAVSGGGQENVVMVVVVVKGGWIGGDSGSMDGGIDGSGSVTE
jgi:hypothetical protein